MSNHVGERMLEKYITRVRVETQLVKVQCPNKECSGELKYDGKQRTELGIHGGNYEYRHVCSAKCGTGVWMGDQYPKVEYREVAGAGETVGKETDNGGTVAVDTAVHSGESGAAGEPVGRIKVAKSRRAGISG